MGRRMLSYFDAGHGIMKEISTADVAFQIKMNAWTVEVL